MKQVHCISILKQARQDRTHIVNHVGGRGGLLERLLKAKTDKNNRTFPIVFSDHAVSATYLVLGRRMSHTHVLRAVKPTMHD